MNHKENKIINRQVTLQDIAREADVSISTVSRILDDRYPASKSISARKVREVAERLGYRRDVMASSLRRGDTGTIGVLVPRLTDTVMAILYEALSAAASKRGYFTMVATCGDDPEAQRDAIESFISRRVDGIVLATTRLSDDLAKNLRERGIRHSLVLRTDGISPSSVGDDFQGGYLATRHLLDLGHRRVGLIAGPAFASNAQGRKKGYLTALDEAGIAPDDSLIMDSDFSIESGEEMGYALLCRYDKPSAIFAVNDNLAIGVMAAAHRLGLKLGKEVSLVGYNDIPLVSRLPVPLSSVRIPFEFIALNALDLLFSNELTEKNILNVMPSLIPRASSSRPYE